MAEMAQDRMPTSRVGRTARVGSLAAGQAVRQFGMRATNLARSDDGRRRALERRNVEAAEQIVTALGTMKGAAMKLGQVLSFLDVGLVPEEHREEFQRKLAKLRDAAPKVRFKDMRKVIEEELDEPLDEVFADFQEEPIAAASIGQVYRAVLHDGREVAVKVQYPGVGSAVRADMQNLGLILRLMRSVAPGLDAKAIGDEVRTRVVEELDYELEASNQRALARIFRGHPFIVIPDVVSSLSRERVMVSEFVHGVGFEQIKERDQATRDRVGEIVFRFFFGSVYRHRQFSGDPHPGNYLLLDDGRVAFLDFGLFKRMDERAVELELHILRAVAECDADEVFRTFKENGFLSDPDRFEPERLFAQLRDGTAWYMTDEDVQLTPELASEIVIEASDPRSTYFDDMRHQTLPGEHVFARRVELLTMAVLSQLRASNNWFRIMCEWLYGDPPFTELGELEAAFYSRAAA
jgi:predicted unusual protein kinase regulating ubiquinone biosynthesis (AarF/ABC1/UbiB family)